MLVESYIVPTVYKSHLDGKTYVVADGKYTEVEEGFQWKDIVWRQKEFKNPRPKKDAKVKEQSWSVKGSKGNEYVVSVKANSWSCTCHAFAYSPSRTCKHIKQIKGS